MASPLRGVYFRQEWGKLKERAKTHPGNASKIGREAIALANKERKFDPIHAKAELNAVRKLLTQTPKAAWKTFVQNAGLELQGAFFDYELPEVNEEFDLQDARRALETEKNDLDPQTYKDGLDILKNIEKSLQKFEKPTKVIEKSIEAKNEHVKELYSELYKLVKLDFNPLHKTLDLMAVQEFLAHSENPEVKKIVGKCYKIIDELNELHRLNPEIDPRNDIDVELRNAISDFKISYKNWCVTEKHVTVDPKAEALLRKFSLKSPNPEGLETFFQNIPNPILRARGLVILQAKRELEFNKMHPRVLEGLGLTTEQISQAPVQTAYLGRLAAEPPISLKDRMTATWHNVMGKVSPYKSKGAVGQSYEDAKAFNEGNPYKNINAKQYGGDNPAALQRAVIETLSKERPSYETKAVLVPGDTVMNAHQLSDTVKPPRKLGVVNCANRHMPGGSWKHGRGSQEEPWFRLSNIYNALKYVAGYVRKGLKNHIPAAGAIITPRVKTKVPGKEDETFECDLVSIAAVDNRRFSSERAEIKKIAKKTGQTPEAVFKQITKNKYTALFGAFLENGTTDILMSIPGLGSFKNDPKLIKEVLDELLFKDGAPFKDKFASVTFNVFDFSEKNATTVGMLKDLGVTEPPSKQDDKQVERSFKEIKKLVESQQERLEFKADYQSIVDMSEQMNWGFKFSVPPLLNNPALVLNTLEHFLKKHPGKSLERMQLVGAMSKKIAHIRTTYGPIPYPEPNSLEGILEKALLVVAKPNDFKKKEDESEEARLSRIKKIIQETPPASETLTAQALAAVDLLLEMEKHSRPT